MDMKNGIFGGKSKKTKNPPQGSRSCGDPDEWAYPLIKEPEAEISQQLTDHFNKKRPSMSADQVHQLAAISQEEGIKPNRLIYYVLAPHLLGLQMMVALFEWAAKRELNLGYFDLVPNGRGVNIQACGEVIPVHFQIKFPNGRVINV